MLSTAWASIRQMDWIDGTLTPSPKHNYAYLYLCSGSGGRAGLRWTVFVGCLFPFFLFFFFSFCFFLGGVLVFFFSGVSFPFHVGWMDIYVIR
ncbi:hypothetical protein GYMLUDRAFT_969363 [Collybiopsis luxurians FD-317 M1]|uniref:Uncharacterized protein n=1 Tax=Collybiopsis luxurians FD-317 M1 TaxID=944289 RepID=A0A0D0BD16_9AGAR|nr:hypothetical protein GYMLUDRAFT_969363 [Collybiopsis luxurians FD-317 M1]